MAESDFLATLSGEFRPVQNTEQQRFAPEDVIRFKYPRGDRIGQDRAVRVLRLETEGLPFNSWKVMRWDPAAMGVGKIGAERTYYRHLMRDLRVLVPASPLPQLEDGAA